MLLLSYFFSTCVVVKNNYEIRVLICVWAPLVRLKWFELVIYLNLLFFFQNENHFFANSMQWRKKWEKILLKHIVTYSCYLWYVVNVAHGGLFAFLGPQWNQKLICFFAQSLFGLWTLAGVGWWCRDHPQYGKIIQKEVLGVQLFMKNQILGEWGGRELFLTFLTEAV